MSAAASDVATVSVREAAYFLVMSPSTVRKLVRGGWIRGSVTSEGGRQSYRVDRQWLLDFAHVDGFDFEGIPFPPAPPPTHRDMAAAVALAMGRRRRKETGQ